MFRIIGIEARDGEGFPSHYWNVDIALDIPEGTFLYRLVAHRETDKWVTFPYEYKLDDDGAEVEDDFDMFAAPWIGKMQLLTHMQPIIEEYFYHKDRIEAIMADNQKRFAIPSRTE